eukprot:g15239.t1
MSGAIVMTLQVIFELWKPFGGAYTVDTALSRMVAGSSASAKRCGSPTTRRPRRPPPCGAPEMGREAVGGSKGVELKIGLQEDNMTLKQLHESLQDLYRRLQEERDALKRRLRQEQEWLSKTTALDELKLSWHD